MAIGQGLYKTVAFKKQSALGTPASGAGGTLIRRETATFNKTKATFNNNEINSHQQYTGDTYGVSKTGGTISGVLSSGSYAPFFGSINRKDFVVVTAIASLSLTIAGSGPFTITRGSGSFLTDGVKIGDVVRITAGTYTGIARDLNLIVTGVVALVLTVVVANGKVLAAQGPIASSTISVIGKKSVTPVSGQTNDYYTFDELYADVSLDRVYSDMQFASVDVSIPATGNATVQFALLGLVRTKGVAASLTSPAAASTTTILTAANAFIMIAGAQTTVGTSLSLKIDGQMQHGDPVIGSKTISDIVKSDLKVSGSVSVQYNAETISNLFDNETAAAVIGVLFADTSDTSDFIGFTVPRSKFMKDDIDDGKKQLVMACDFTAEINSGGGAALANDQGIISIQDSAA